MDNPKFTIYKDVLGDYVVDLIYEDGSSYFIGAFTEEKYAKLLVYDIILAAKNENLEDWI